jgi:hypothetical protein
MVEYKMARVIASPSVGVPATLKARVGQMARAIDT